MVATGRAPAKRRWEDAQREGASAGKCAWPGCACDATHPAPRSRDRLRDYQWFCIEHVREYNAAWNYYAGMSDNEVEADIRADTVWQRPSWPLGQDGRSFAGGRARITDGFGFFSGQDPPPAQTKATAQQLALVVLDLEPPVTVAILKARYKQLVKRFHPDANGGDKVAEERFKEITAAYRTVLSSLT